MPSNRTRIVLQGCFSYDNYMAHVNTANVSEGLVAFAMSPQAGTKSYAFNTYLETRRAMEVPTT